MYQGKCKHGVVVAGCVDPDLDLEHSSFSDVVKEYIDFGHFVKHMLDEGLIISKCDSITVKPCEMCEYVKNNRGCPPQLIPKELVGMEPMAPPIKVPRIPI